MISRQYMYSGGCERKPSPATWLLVQGHSATVPTLRECVGPYRDMLECLMDHAQSAAAVAGARSAAGVACGSGLALSIRRWMRVPNVWCSTAEFFRSTFDSSVEM